MSAKPTELRKLVALLDQEAPSAEWLAKEIFELISMNTSPKTGELTQ